MSRRWALVCSAHGFGHTARQLELARALVARGDAVTLVSAAPASFVAEAGVPLRHERVTVDVGLVQADSVHEDPDATERALDALLDEAHLDRLTHLVARFDAVVVDVAPVVLEACRRAGVPAVALGNFDWAWIYAALGMTRWAERFAAWQGHHPAVFVGPGPGMHHFRVVRDGGLLARALPPAPPLGLDGRAVLVSFGGLGLGRLAALLPVLPGVTWVTGPPLSPLPREDCLHVPEVAYPSLLHRVDAVLTKPGYGVYGETHRTGVPVAFLPRPGFPETPSLTEALLARGDVQVAVGPDHPDARQAIAAAVTAVLERGRRVPSPGDTEQVLEAVLQSVEDG